MIGNKENWEGHHDLQRLISIYEALEVNHVPLETFRMAENYMGIISAPTHFGEKVDDEALIAKMLQFESARLGADPDLPMKAQIGQEEFERLNAKYALVAIAKDTNQDEITLRQAVTAAVTTAAELAGIHQRWVAIHEKEKSKIEVIAKSVAIGVRLLREYISQFSEEPEGIILTSSFLPKNMAELIIDRALLEGVLTKKPKFFEIRLYCAGSAAAMAVALTHPEFSQMSNVAILVCEPISALVDKEHSGFDHHQSAVIFSDDFLAMRLDPRKFKLSPDSVLTAIDDNGAIQLESWLESFDATDAEAIPDWAKELLRDGEPDLLYVDHNCLIIKMRSPEAGQPRALMNPKRTAKFFAFNSPAKIIELLKKHLIKHLFNHEPSYGVIDLIRRGLGRLREKVNEILKKEGKNTIDSVPDFVWTGQGNSSSGTFFRQLVELAKNGQLDEQAFLEPTMIFAPGAGATFAVLVIERRVDAKPVETIIFSAPDSD